MSFRCQQCNAPQGSRVKPIRVVVETRTVTYPMAKDKIPVGYETVREVELCKKCYAQHK